MRDTNDVKYEFKFDHVLILVPALERIQTRRGSRPQKEPNIYYIYIYIIHTQMDKYYVLPMPAG